MNISAKVGLLFAASALAFSSLGRAQLQTYQTQSAYRGSMTTFLSEEVGETMGQTFYNVSAVKSMTYNFFVGTGSSGVSAATELEAVFGEWNGSSFVSGTTVSFGTIEVPASNSGQWTTLTNSGGTYTTFAYQFDLASLTSEFTHGTFGYLTNASKTYALMLTNTTGSETNLGLGVTNNNTAFAYGEGFDGSEYYRDWVFAQIVVAPGNQQLVPVPESSTVAAVASAALVAGLVGFRLRQRRSALQAQPLLPEVAAA